MYSIRKEVQRKKMTNCEVESSKSELRQEQGFCGKGDEPSGYIKCVEFLE
jgi:hypothetical protein